MISQLTFLLDCCLKFRSCPLVIQVVPCVLTCLLKQLSNFEIERTDISDEAKTIYSSRRYHLIPDVNTEHDRGINSIGVNRRGRKQLKTSALSQPNRALWVLRPVGVGLHCLALMWRQSTIGFPLLILIHARLWALGGSCGSSLVWAPGPAAILLPWLDIVVG